MINGRFYSQKNWVPMIHGYGSVYPIPGSFHPRYNQVAGPGECFCTHDTMEPIFKYPYLDTNIQLMSVLQTRDWIWNLGSSLGWDFKDSWANAISFCENRIDGSQLVNMDIKDLCKLKIVKKLGHKIAIVNTVKTLKNRANVMKQGMEKCAGYLGNDSQIVWNESSPFTKGIVFPNTKYAKLAFQERGKVGHNVGKYHRPRPSAHNPRINEAFRRLPFSEDKSPSSKITTHIEEGTVVTVNMPKKQRTGIVKHKANGESELIRWVSTHSETGDQQLAPYDDSSTFKKSK